jgi:hypothetical protein
VKHAGAYGREGFFFAAEAEAEEDVDVDDDADEDEVVVYEAGSF